MKTPSRISLLLVFAFAEAFLLQHPAEAATKTWSGLGLDNKWSTPGNWSPSGAPAPGDDLVFPAGAAQLSNNNDTAAGTSYNSISFTGPVGGYTLSGNAIQLVAGITANNSSPNSVSLPITLTASQTFSSSGVRLKLDAAVDLGANTLTFTTPASGVLEANAGIAGTGGVTSTGPGVVFINGATTYSGPTNITGGNFVINAVTLNPVSVVTVTGGLLQFSNGGGAGPVTVTSGAILCGGGGTSQIGNVTDLTMQTGTNLTMSMFTVSNFGQLNASGAVTLNNTALNLSWSFTSSLGNTFMIINKTSAGAITGTFSGLPEGATFTANGRNYQITYVGGDGNDVVVTDIGAAVTPTPTVTPTATATPVSTSTPTPPAPAAVVPTLGPSGLAVLVGLLAFAALLMIRRSSL